MKPERNLHAAKRPSANRDSNLQPVVLCPGLKSRNRRIRTRMYGGVGGVGPRGLPLSRFHPTDPRAFCRTRPRVPHRLASIQRSHVLGNRCTSYFAEA